MTNEQPLYYAKDGAVFQRPIHKRNGDGSTNVALGFRICTMSEYVGDDAAETVAALMNAGHEAMARTEIEAAHD